jgi:hypothetical protein
MAFNLEDDTLLFEQAGAAAWRPEAQRLVVWFGDVPDEGLDFAAADSSEEYGGTHLLYQDVYLRRSNMTMTWVEARADGLTAARKPGS